MSVPASVQQERLDAWLRDRERQAKKEREERRVEWFVVDQRAIPDLEFLTPECPVCGLYTTYEDGSFYCEECRVLWPSTGYGTQATREDDA